MIYILLNHEILYKYFGATRERFAGRYGEKRSYYQKEIMNIEKIAEISGKVYVSTLHISLEVFKEHISNVHHSMIGDLNLLRYPGF